jgi:hypothetical protein
MAAIPILAGVPLHLAGQEAGTCGHCHEMEVFGFSGERVHQMVDHDPRFVECSGGGGHLVHDCDSGDGSMWAPGGCDSHAPCGEPDFSGTYMAMLSSASLAQVHGPAGLTTTGQASAVLPSILRELQRVARCEAENVHSLTSRIQVARQPAERSRAAEPRNPVVAGRAGS